MDPLTLILVAHGRADVLKKTLRSLADCHLPDAFQGTILAENGPECGMASVVSEFQDTLRIQHLRVADRRKSVALNIALQQAVHGWALFIDDDVRVSPDWMICYAQAIQQHPQGYYFGGPTACDYEQPPPDWLKRYLPDSARGLTFPQGATEIRYPDCFLGFNWAARIESLLQAGGFPEQFGPGTEYGGGDESFMQRALAEQGQRGRLVREALVWHQIPADRCTPEWCLKRAFAGGQTTGIEAVWEDRKSARCLASVRSHLRHLKNRLSSIPLLDLFQLSLHGRFWVRRTREWMRGFHAGYRTGFPIAAVPESPAFVNSEARPGGP